MKIKSILFISFIIFSPDALAQMPDFSSLSIPSSSMTGGAVCGMYQNPGQYCKVENRSAIPKECENKPDEGTQQVCAADFWTKKEKDCQKKVQDQTDRQAESCRAEQKRQEANKQAIDTATKAAMAAMACQKKKDMACMMAMMQVMQQFMKTAQEIQQQQQEDKMRAELDKMRKDYGDITAPLASDDKIKKPPACPETDAVCKAGCKTTDLQCIMTALGLDQEVNDEAVVTNVIPESHDPIMGPQVEADSEKSLRDPNVGFDPTDIGRQVATGNGTITPGAPESIVGGSSNSFSLAGGTGDGTSHKVDVNAIGSALARTNMKSFQAGFSDGSLYDSMKSGAIATGFGSGGASTAQQASAVSYGHDSVSIAAVTPAGITAVGGFSAAQRAAALAGAQRAPAAVTPATEESLVGSVLASKAGFADRLPKGSFQYLLDRISSTSISYQRRNLVNTY